MAAGWAVAGLPGLGGHSAGAAPRRPAASLHIAADELTTDSAGAIRARGHVEVAYGGVRVKSDLLRWDRPVGSAKLTGHVVVTGPQGRVTGDAATLLMTGPDNQVVSAVVTGHAAFETPKYALTADEIAADRRSGRLAAQGHVILFSAPDVVVTGDRGAYDQRTQYAVVTGHATAASKDGRLRGAWIELFQSSGRAVVHGPVDAAFSGMTVAGDEAAVTFGAPAAVFTGHVVVTRPGGTVWADRATVFYRDRRIVAEGETRAQFAGGGGGTP